MIQDLIELLSTYSTEDVRQLPIDELMELCDESSSAGIVFKLLCDLCDFLRSPPVKKALK